MVGTDLAIVGAGPAGMAAAAMAAGLGLSVAVLDEQPLPGGQIYRGVTAGGAMRADVLGADYLRGAALAAGLMGSGVLHIAGATVWKIDQEDGFTLTYSQNGAAHQIRAQRLILATGALERPVPLPGWTLPGVMTAGAGQIMLKASGVVARRAVLAGSGPLLFLLAVQMVRAGIPPLALVETSSRADLIRALRHLPGAWRGWRVLAKGLGLLWELRRAGVPMYRGATRLAVEGQGRAEALAFEVRGQRRRIACDTVLLHEGVVANTQASRSLGLGHVWDAGEQAFRPEVDAWGETDAPGLFIAGDGAGIGGAGAAEEAGRIAALQAAFQAGRIDVAERDRRARGPRQKLTAERSVRAFLNAAYPPSEQVLRPDDATIICRCEEVTAGAVRGYARLGCRGPNQTKAFGRVGMGPCQGRYCGLTVTRILADETGQSPGEVGAYRIRPPLKPVTLGEVAGLAETGG